MTTVDWYFQQESIVNKIFCFCCHDNISVIVHALQAEESINEEQKSDVRIALENEMKKLVEQEKQQVQLAQETQNKAMKVKLKQSTLFLNWSHFMILIYLIK